MKALDHILKLKRCGDPPCSDATDWVRSLGPSVTMEQIWEQCPRGDWLAWYLDVVGGWDDRLLRLFAADCAARALRRARDSGREPDERSWHAVAVARAFADGQATREDLYAAWNAAWDAAEVAARNARAARAARAAAEDAWAAAEVAARNAAEAARDAAEMGMQADWIRQNVPFQATKETI